LQNIPYCIIVTHSALAVYERDIFMAFASEVRHQDLNMVL